MSDSAIQKWNSLTLLQKVLLFAGLPLVILLFVSGAGRSVLAYLEKLTRSKVDDKSKTMDQEIKKQTAEADRAKGRLEQLEKERTDAVKKAKDNSSQQAADFWNSRPGPGDQ
jgi:hypothetical protein